MTTTQAAILAGLQTAMLNLAELHMRPKRHHRPKYDGAALRAIRAKNGVGRPKPVLVPLDVIPSRSYPMHWALNMNGTQRAAAKALGLNLSTFQRRLAKEAA